MRNSAVLSLLILLGVAVGCSNESGGGAAEDDVPADELVSELSSAENKRLCTTALKQFERIEATAVRVSCAFNELGNEDCEEAIERCVEEDAKTESSADCETEADSVTGRKTCRVTVAEFRACLNALVKISDEFAETVECDSTIESLDPATEPPKVCRDIADDCDRFAQLRQ